MGVIIVSLLVTAVIAISMFIGTAVLLAVAPRELWDQPTELLHKVGQLDLKTASLHITMFETTVVLLIVLALAILVVSLLKLKDEKRQDLIVNLTTVGFYVTFLAFLGNAGFYLYHLFIRFNPLV